MIRQKAEVREIFLELQRQMDRLAVDLEAQQPEDAKRLRNASVEVTESPSFCPPV